ncbi:hypothetical protein [Metabacillus idriensis]|uniref:hypothetical protein n=1 Tax=Metabacillus idriensis TaxID=324768 RepID=UPI003D2D46F2
MKHIASAIYFSFGFLFYFLQWFGGFYAPPFISFIIFLFFCAGFAYFLSAIRPSKQSGE